MWNFIGTLSFVFEHFGSYFGSLKIGSSNAVIISQNIAFANTKRQVFAETLQFFLLVSDVAKQVDEFNVLDKFYSRTHISMVKK